MNGRPMFALPYMDPVIRTDTIHEQTDRRMMIVCVVGTAPLAAIIVALIYSIA